MCRIRGAGRDGEMMLQGRATGGQDGCHSRAASPSEINTTTEGQGQRTLCDLG